MPNGAAPPPNDQRVVKTPDADTIFKAIKKDQEMPVEGNEPTEQTPASGGDTPASNPRSTPVRVLNAAQTEGLGTAMRASMVDLGYTVTGVQTAQKPATTTRIFVDGTPGAKAAAEALNTDFGLKAQIVEQKISGVWLILGSDRVQAGTDPVKPKPVKATTRKADASICA
jgi:hypothetical protein